MTINWPPLLIIGTTLVVIGYTIAWVQAWRAK